MEPKPGVHLRLQGTAASVSFVCGPDALDVATECAARSKLIKDLQDQEPGDTSMPVPLSMDEVQAWLTCCSGNGLIGEDDSQQIVRLGNESIDDLGPILGARKAADFLGDTDTLAGVARALAARVMWLDETRPYPIVAAERDQACEVLRAVPEPFVVDVLHQIHLRFDKLVASCILDEPVHIHELLELLPRSFHTAIFQACCSEPGRDGAYVVQTLERGEHVEVGRNSTVCADAEDGSSSDDDGDSIRGGYHDVLGAGVTPIFELLAAAVPLAGGIVQRAWDPYAIAALMQEPHGPERRKRERPQATSDVAAPAICMASPGYSQDTCERPWESFAQTRESTGPNSEVAQGAPLPGCLTRLNLDLTHVNADAPRWCAALAELRSLQELSVDAWDGHVWYMPEFTAALRRLSALTSLTVSVQIDVFDHMIGRLNETDCPSLTMQLLDTVSGMTQLSALSLQRCVDLLSERVPEDDAVGCAAVSGLSRLSLLTSLTLVDTVSTVPWNAVLGGALKQLRALGELRMTPCSILDGEGAAEALALEVCSCAQLTALRGIFFGSFLMGAAAEGCSERSKLPVVRLHDAIVKHNPTLLPRMTALHLKNSFIGSSQNGHLAVFLSAMPALQSLSLSGNQLQRSGLASLARVLPQLTALTHLDISDNCVRDAPMHVGMLEVLAALLEPGAARAERLRELDIGFNRIRPQDARQLPALLRQFRGLRVLGMRSLELGLEGMAAVTKVLGGLPQLTSLDVRGNITAQSNVRPPDPEAVQSLFSGLGHLSELVRDTVSDDH